MIKENVTLDFLIEEMTKEREEDIIVLREEIENELENLLRQLEEDDEDGMLEECKQVLESVENCQDDDIAYDIYYNFYWKITVGYDEVIEELNNKRKSQIMDKYRIEELASKYLEIIKEMPDIEFDIEFSKKSPSIYVKTNMEATEENLELFTNLGGFCFTEYNMYEEYECYEGNIELRLSDHDFGGFTRLSGYGEYVSYEKSCINYVYEF